MTPYNKQEDGNTADIKDAQLRKKKREDEFIDIFEDSLSNPSQIDDMITSTTATERRGNLRGSSSSSTAAVVVPSEEEADDAPPPASQIIKDIELINLETKAQKHLKNLMIEIKHNLKEGLNPTKTQDLYDEHFKILNILTEIKQLKNIENNKTQQAIEDIAELQEQLIKIF